MVGELKERWLSSRASRALCAATKRAKRRVFSTNFSARWDTSAIEAGATFEFRVAEKPGSPQLQLIKGRAARRKCGKKFANLLWPDRVLLEMKSRGTKVEEYYDQAFDYWSHIVPKRPPLVILCNFDEFWIGFGLAVLGCSNRMSSCQVSPS